MRLRLQCITFLVFLYRALSDGPVGAVLKLAQFNFESTVFRSGKNGMVKFYQSWCGHSIKMKPTWEQLAQLSDPSIFIASIDCGKEMDLCKSYHITTYPTFRYYVNGVEHDYDDAKSLEALREFVDTTLAPRCNPINNISACSERGKEYGVKWIAKSNVSDGATLLQSEITRLDKMLFDPQSVTPDLLRWMRERRDILQTIQQTKLGTNENHVKKSSSDEEL